MIKFYLPGLWSYFDLYQVLIPMMQTKSNWFYPNIQIGAIYGIFPNAIWGGGRAILGGFNMQDVQHHLKWYNQNNIPIRYTFTNSLLQQEHLTNPYCNYLLQEAIQVHDNVEVLVNSPLLYQYLQEHYPQVSLIASITQRISTLPEIESACEKYKMVVLPTNLNHNLQTINELKSKDRIELLVNSACDPHCPNFHAHYNAFSLSNLLQSNANLQQWQCNKMSYTFFDRFNLQSTIAVDELYSTYAHMGFNNFKIEGRSIQVTEVIESILYYLVMPQYIDQARLYIYNQLFNH